MSITRSHNGKRSGKRSVKRSSKRSSGRASSGRRSRSARHTDPLPKGPIDPSSHSLPGTALHRLSLLVGEASRGIGPSPNRKDEYLHLRNPRQVAEDLRGRVIALGPSAKKRLAVKVAPDVTTPRILPLGLVSLGAGVVLLVTGHYWGLPLLAYGALALLFNSVSKRRHNRVLLAAIDKAIEPDLRLLSSDRTRAEAIASRFADTGRLDFLDGGEAPSEVPLPQGERVLLVAPGVIKARFTKEGMLREAEGLVLVTTSRLLFCAPVELAEMELSRVVRADVIDEIRLVIVPSKREAPGVYFSLGNAHTLAQVIRLARESLQV